MLPPDPPGSRDRLLTRLGAVVLAALTPCCGNPPQAARDAADGSSPCRAAQPLVAAPRRCDHFRRHPGRPRGFLSLTNRLRTVAGINHSGQDVVTRPGEGATLLAQFAYGPFGFRLVDEEVQTYVHDCHSWLSVHDSRTNGSGRIAPTAAVQHLPAGSYAVGHSVSGDGSTTHSTLFVLPPKQHFVVFNIDGTLTSAPPASFYSAVGGQAYYSQLADKLAPQLREEAAELTRVWAAKGYRILYLTARPLHLRRITESWLQEHDFAAGVLHFSESSLDLLPYNACVGTYKARFLESLQQMGHDLDVAYGATTTDMYAYKRVGVPQLYAVGFVPLENTAVRLDLLTSHLEMIKEMGPLDDARSPPG